MSQKKRPEQPVNNKQTTVPQQGMNCILANTTFYSHPECSPNLDQLFSLVALLAETKSNTLPSNYSFHETRDNTSTTTTTTTKQSPKTTTNVSGGGKQQNASKSSYTALNTKTNPNPQPKPSSSPSSSKATAQAHAKPPSQRPHANDNIIARVCDDLLPRLQAKAIAPSLGYAVPSTASTTTASASLELLANQSQQPSANATTTTNNNRSSSFSMPNHPSTNASFLRQFLEAIVSVGRLKPIHFHSPHQLSVVIDTLLLLLAENRSHAESLTCVLRALSFVLLDNGPRCEQFEVVVQTLAPLISLTTGTIGRWRGCCIVLMSLILSLFILFLRFFLLCQHE
jgi:hypothetical protein